MYLQKNIYLLFQQPLMKSARYFCVSEYQVSFLGNTSPHCAQNSCLVGWRPPPVYHLYVFIRLLLKPTSAQRVQNHPSQMTLQPYYY